MSAAPAKKTSKRKSKAGSKAAPQARAAGNSSSAPSDGSILIRGAQVVTLDDQERIGSFDLRIKAGHIDEVGVNLAAAGAEVLDASGLVAIPGFVQAHVHLCQTLFRGLADDMQLLDWLGTHIWPMEGALHEADMRASARLGISELLLGGTTAILDMGSVHHTDVLFEEAKHAGIRYTGGKTIMDDGQGFADNLRETTRAALDESSRLCKQWHGQEDGRLRYAFSPRFALSTSVEAFRAGVALAREQGALLHTHTSENPEEVQLVRGRTGMGNVEYLHSLGFTGPDVVLVHCVWLSLAERKLIRDTGSKVVHCPSANLKLASGIARISEYLDEGINVALGGDGAPCNNRLDAFTEMRTAALLHKVRGGPTAVNARQALRMATVYGAQALGYDDLGTLAVGQRADIVLLDLNKPHTFPANADLVSRIVYSAQSSDVHTVMVDGKVLVDDRQLRAYDVADVLQRATEASRGVVQRIQ